MCLLNTVKIHTLLIIIEDNFSRILNIIIKREKSSIHITIYHFWLEKDLNSLISKSNKYFIIFLKKFIYTTFFIFFACFDVIFFLNYFLEVDFIDIIHDLGFMMTILILFVGHYCMIIEVCDHLAIIKKHEKSIFFISYHFHYFTLPLLTYTLTLVRHHLTLTFFSLLKITFKIIFQFLLIFPPLLCFKIIFQFLLIFPPLLFLFLLHFLQTNYNSCK